MTEREIAGGAARLFLGDSFDVLAELPAGSVDAVVTDPPYGIRFMGQAWDGSEIEEQAQRQHSAMVEAVQRGELDRGGRKTSALSNSSMQAGAYDFSPRGMVAFQEWSREWSRLALRLLKPGGHLVSFSSSRTYHRMVCGVEEAGFEIRDQVMWIYSTGFPKSLDVGKAIDAKLGVEREVVGAKAVSRVMKGSGEMVGGHVRAGQIDVTAPATSEGETWNGWGTALKPAHEPAVVARKPLAGTVAENVLEHGTGALNIAAARVGESGGIRTLERHQGETGGATNFPPRPSAVEQLDAGRWPANVVLSHLEECKGSGPHHTDALCAPGCPVAELNAASGESSTPSMVTRGTSGGEFLSGVRAEKQRVPAQGVARGAARFFYIAKTRRRERHAGTTENRHPTVKPLDLMRWLVRLTTPSGGVVLDPFMGSGSTGLAALVEGCRFIGIEREEPSFETSLQRISDRAFALGLTPRTASATTRPAGG